MDLLDVCGADGVYLEVRPSSDAAAQGSTGTRCEGVTSFIFYTTFYDVKK